MTAPARGATAGHPAAAMVEPVGLLLGLGVDALFGDPRRGHPVAAYGRASAEVQRLLERDSRLAGTVFWLASAGTMTALGGLCARLTAARPAGRLLGVAAATWAALGGTSLAREATAIAGAVDAGDLAAARTLLPHLCGRDPAALDAAGLLRAVIESVAENTGDAVLSPLLCGAVAGVAGLLGFRALNTLDAVVGHHSERYERFGWASARVDDVAGYLPARLGAALACALAPAVGGARDAAVTAWRDDAPAHPSPNAGPLEAAFAGALGLRLGGALRYPYGVSERPWLNPSGRDPVAADVTRAIRLSRLVSLATAAVSVLVSAGRNAR